MQILAVSELTGYLKALMEEDYDLRELWVRGEVTNFTQSAAGHRYFSLKDERSVVRCVLFASRGTNAPAMSVPAMRNGMAVLAHGRMSFYEARGDLQFYVETIEDAGVGALHLRFEAVKARLEAEGLFSPKRKRPIPRCPTTVGVVTSTAAAALRDIVRTLRMRCPLVRVVVAPALVQGEGAAEQIASALDMLNAYGQCDVIVIARGGGSLEELWAFNEEVVARAIARSLAPVVSGIGHETDFTIADFVADVRASTPTAAATRVVPNVAEWRIDLSESAQRLDGALDGYLARRRDEVMATARRVERASPDRQVADARRRAGSLAAALETHLRHGLDLRRERLRGAALHLHALSPLATLERGFAIVRRETDGMLVTSVRHVGAGVRLSIRVGDGVIPAVADTPVVVAITPGFEPLATTRRESVS